MQQGRHAATPPRPSNPCSSTRPFTCFLFLCSVQHAAAILQRAQECNPLTWSPSAAAASNHVTAGKHSPADRQRLQAALLADPRIRAHLCALTQVLGYEESRCGVVAARRLLASAA